MSSKTQNHTASSLNGISNSEETENLNSPSNLNGAQDPFGNLEPPPVDRADLPTFPMEFGWRERYDPETGISHRSPLTLLDLLYPTEDDIGVVTMAQSYFHDYWLSILVSMFRGYLPLEDWLVTSDVLIFWNRGTATPKAPDLALIPKGQEPVGKDKSYHVGRHGPTPVFALEITSTDTRDTDLNEKRIHYAAVGVQEYLIIDMESPNTDKWPLLGYRLGNSPYYEPIEPDADGGLTFETIGFRFVTIGRSKIEVYNTTSSERLLSLSEQDKRAREAEVKVREAEVKVRESEVKAREEASARQEAEEEAARILAENESLREELERLRKAK